MAIEIEFEGEWAERYKKLSVEFDIDVVVASRLAAGETIDQIKPTIAGPTSFFFFRDKMMVRSVDEFSYEVWFTTGGWTMKAYEGFEKQWLMMIAANEFEKFMQK